MAYLMSQQTKDFVDRLKNTNSMLSKARRGWIFQGTGGGGDVSVCQINGGNPLAGYSATAYPSMAALRDPDGEGKIVTIYPVEIGLDAVLPQGTIVLCHTIQCAVTGGSENSEQQGGGNS